MNMAQGIGIYLSVYRAAKGAGASVAFPGYEHGYHSTHSDTSQDLLARMELYAAINHDECGNGRAFNIADGEVVTWAQVWPGLCEHFGLVGSGPVEGSEPMADFVRGNDDVWQALVKKFGLREEVVREQNWGHVHFMLVQFDFDRQYDLSAARGVGFHEEIKTVDGYIAAWQRMRSARILPPL